MCGTGTGVGGKADGCVLAHWPRGSRGLRAQTALPGRVGRDRASPARFWTAAGALAALPGGRPRWAAVTGRRGGRLPSALSFHVWPQFCGLPLSADRPQRRDTHRGNYFGEAVPSVRWGGRARRRLARLCVARARAGWSDWDFWGQVALCQALELSR